jgi:hypothetical protein
MLRKTGDALPLRCSFCNKSADDVRKLIAGPQVFICDECVGICNEIIVQDTRFARPEAATALAEQGRAMAGQGEGRASATDFNQAFPCRLCGLPTMFDEAVIVEERGGLCAGCVAAVEAAAEARRSDSRTP